MFNKTKKSNGLLATLSCASVLGLTLPATGVSAQLEEIIVTASKRAQSLDDVGAAVAAISAEDLKQQHVVAGSDLARVTPGLAYATTPNNTPVFTLRGIGFYDQSLAATPDVALYIDQVSLPLPIMATKTMFDLERVEVLKGPQGTLFGNNATGGAINFIAAKPTEELSAGLDVGYGRFNTFELGGFVSGALSDNLRGRVAVKSEKSDAWQKSSSRNDEIGEKENFAARVMLDWDATESLRFSLNVNGWQDKDEPQAARITKVKIVNPIGTAGFGGAVPANLPVLTVPLSPSDSRAADWTSGDLRPFNDTEFWQVALRTDFDINDKLTLTSLSSYSELDFDKAQDQDGSFLTLFQNDNHHGSVESFSQELRLANSAENQLRWVVGANMERTETEEVADLWSIDSSSASVNGAGLVRDQNSQELDNIAGFANLEFDLNDKLTLKAGVRRTKAERESNAAGFTSPEMPIPAGLPYSFTDFFNLVYPFLYGTDFPHIVEGESFVLDTRANADGSPVDPNTFGTTAKHTGKLDEETTSWSLGVNYAPTDDLLLYGNISKGYKSGSFPFLAAAIFDGLEPVVQEELLSYEAGFKAQFPEQGFSLNGTAFFYDYTDKQLLTKFVDPVFGELDRLQNVPESEVKGVEFELRTQPFDSLALSASITYLDAKVTEYTGVIGATPGAFGLEAVTASFGGADLPFSAEWQYSLRADYEFAVTDKLQGFIGASVNGQTDSFSTLVITEEQEQDFELEGYATVDISFGVRAEDELWSITVWGRNVTDKNYATNKFLNYDTQVEFTGRPREYGVTFSMNY